MISTARACLPYLIPLLLPVFVVGCGGGGGGGSSAPGPGGSTAPPTVATLEATSIGPIGATFNGTVTPNGLPTEFWFEYGTKPNLDPYDNTSRLPVGTGSPSQTVVCAVSGLASGTVYHYRICASNSLGTTRSPIVDFTTRTCLQCHGGADGTQPGVNGAPVISRYWQTSGHGRSFPSRALFGLVACEECHDVGYLSGAAHMTDGTAGSGPPANVNTLMWPGKTADGHNSPTANTSHLKQAYFPSSPTRKYDFARAFDKRCGDPASGCHRYPPHNNHPQVPAGSSDPADYVMRFGDSTTVPNPKSYSWYPEAADYATDFCKSRSPWEIGDLTTNAAGVGIDNGVQYGTCVSCHDPHGSGATDSLASGSNAMVRGNWTDNSAGQFCNRACHTSRTPP